MAFKKIDEVEEFIGGAKDSTKEESKEKKVHCTYYLSKSVRDALDEFMKTKARYGESRGVIVEKALLAFFENR